MFDAAHGRVILADIVVTNVVCATHRDNGAITRGAAAVAATQAKHRKVSREQSVSKDDYFLPLAFESEGYSVNAVQTLLFGFAKHRAQIGSPTQVKMRRTRPPIIMSDDAGQPFYLIRVQCAASQERAAVRKDRHQITNLISEFCMLVTLTAREVAVGTVNFTW